MPHTMRRALRTARRLVVVWLSTAHHRRRGRWPKRVRVGWANPLHALRQSQRTSTYLLLRARRLLLLD